MIQSAPALFEMRRELPATFEAVEEFIADFRRWGQVLLDRESWFAAELLVREALANAVAHGCHADPSKQVRCCLRLKDGRLLIAVEDYGCGFNWRAAWSDRRRRRIVPDAVSRSCVNMPAASGTTTGATR